MPNAGNDPEQRGILDHRDQGRRTQLYRRVI